MTIKAIKLFQDGFMVQPFAFGGEEGPAAYNPAIRYRSSLQNYLIDTGKEVILVDTGMPDGYPGQVVEAKTMLYMGEKISDYLPALEKAGYTSGQVTKILVTHKHADHTGALKHFPQAKIYASEIEAKATELQLPNVVPVGFTDGPYANFPASQTICEGVHFIAAPGHTTGNSIVIVEDGGLFYLIHGDVTYCDEALYANKLSVVYEDKAAARETLDMVRAFIATHPTVYVSTHTPLGWENLEAKHVVDLDNPPAVIPPKEPKARKTATGKYVCGVCGYVYDPAVGDPSQGIAPGTPFEKLPEDWHCPRCKQPKAKFGKA